MLVAAIELRVDLGDTVLESTWIKNVVVLDCLWGPHLMHQVYILCSSGRVCGGKCEGGRGSVKEGGGREGSVKEGEVGGCG